MVLPEDILPEEFEDFFIRFNLLSYAKKDIILQAGDDLTHIFYIKSGFVRVYRISKQGEELTLAILKPYDLFPIAWGDNGAPFECFLEAVTPVSLWRVSRNQFMEFLSTHPVVFNKLVSSMSRRLGGLLTRIEYLVTGHACTKVAAAVLACARRFGSERGDRIVIDLPLTHKDIATIVGITRETACLEMKKLERKGLIAHEKRVIVVRDVEGLENESLISAEERFLLNNSL